MAKKINLGPPRIWSVQVWMSPIGDLFLLTANPTGFQCLHYNKTQSKEGSWPCVAGSTLHALGFERLEDVRGEYESMQGWI